MPTLQWPAFMNIAMSRPTVRNFRSRRSPIVSPTPPYVRVRIRRFGGLSGRFGRQGCDAERGEEAFGRAMVNLCDRAHKLWRRSRGSNHDSNSKALRSPASSKRVSGCRRFNASSITKKRCLPFVIAFMLAPLMEQSLRQSLVMSPDGWRLEKPLYFVVDILFERIDLIRILIRLAVVENPRPLSGKIEIELLRKFG
jgi:hypothetical protein